MESKGTLTYDDLFAFPDDGKRRELIDGELFVSLSPKLRHQRVTVRLTVAFANFLSEHGGGEVFVAPLDVLFSKRDVVEPDVFVVLDEQADIKTEPNIKGVPALVIEVVSDPRFDRIKKRDLYARVGVPEYWIVDPVEDRIDVLHLIEGGYGEPAIFEPGDELPFEPLPGFRLDVAAILAR